jgi:hypothetical protein
MSSYLRVATRLLVVSLLAVVLVTPAEGARRRAVGKAKTPSNPPGQCHTFGLVRPGLKASYVSTTSNGSASYTITYISDAPTQTVTTQVVSTPQGNADARTTVDGEIVGTLRALKHIDLTTTITLPVVGTLSTEVDIDFVPSLAAGPAAGWCVGNTWSVPPVTETIVTRAPFVTPITTTVVTAASTGEVLAVGDTVSVPAGSFRTVKYRGVFVAADTVQTAITWVSMDHNIVVKQDSIDPATGTITTATQLTALQ